MNYVALNKTIINEVMAAIAIINNPEISPEIRQLNQEILLREVGQAVYEKVYGMNAYDFQIEHTTGPGMDDRYFGMAKIASASISTGSLGLADTVRTYLNNVTTQAQSHAFKNAKESGQHPILTWVPNADACKYCRSKAGKHANPNASHFSFHDGCTCSCITEGYRSRNGQLNKYAN